MTLLSWWTCSDQGFVIVETVNELALFVYCN